MHALVVTAPDDLRTRLRGLSRPRLVATAVAFRLRLPLTSTISATQLALKSLAVRYEQLTTEIDALEAQLELLVANAAPDLVAVKGIGTDIATTLLATAGKNPDRLRCEGLAKQRFQFAERQCESLLCHRSEVCLGGHLGEGRYGIYHLLGRGERLDRTADHGSKYLEYLSSAQVKEQITASTNKVEAYHRFAKWLFFGGRGRSWRFTPTSRRSGYSTTTA